MKYTVLYCIKLLLKIQKCITVPTLSVISTFTAHTFYSFKNQANSKNIFFKNVK